MKTPLKIDSPPLSLIGSGRLQMRNAAPTHARIFEKPEIEVGVADVALAESLRRN
jgi:hypothetical protein